MDFLDNLKPGERENAFYLKSDVVDNDRKGEVTEKSKVFYKYVWDPIEKKHVGKLVKR